MTDFKLKFASPHFLQKLRHIGRDRRFQFERFAADRVGEG
jgi:hypothetical protein